MTTKGSMARPRHIEKHFTGSAHLRDVVIGMSDGLTVPFALAAELTGAVSASRIVLTAGAAEITAGAIAMGLGGYLAARGDAEHYASERAREKREVEVVPKLEEKEVAEVFEGYGLTAEQTAPLVKALRARPEAWVDFMMRFELGLEKPEPGRALVSALTIAFAYVAGGVIPLVPYIVVADSTRALPFSAGVTLVALFIFGFVKGRYSGSSPVRSALQTTFIGGLAAGAAFALAKVFS